MTQQCNSPIVRTYGPWWDSWSRTWRAAIVKDGESEMVSCRDREVLETFLAYWIRRQGRVSSVA